MSALLYSLYQLDRFSSCCHVCPVGISFVFCFVVFDSVFVILNIPPSKAFRINSFTFDKIYKHFIVRNCAHSETTTHSQHAKKKKRKLYDKLKDNIYKRRYWKRL